MHDPAHPSCSCCLHHCLRAQQVDSIILGVIRAPPRIEASAVDQPCAFQLLQQRCQTRLVCDITA